MSWRIESPTRVDFAGGTLDCWPLYTLTGGAQTTNLSISVFTRVELVPQPGRSVEIEVLDLGFRGRFESVEDLIQSQDPALALVKAHVNFWRPREGFRLRTQSESPVGGGLGGSSSLCISLIKAFSAWSRRSLSTLEQVNLAHNLEAEILQKPTGTQDYFPAVEPGLSIIHYTAEGARLEKLAVEGSAIKDRLLLVYTGQPHHSGLNNWQVIKAAIDGDKKTLEALRNIKVIGDDVAQACRECRWEDLPGLFQREFEGRVRLSSGFSSPRIEELKKLTLNAGAEAVKICGAGGGGCVFVWVSPERRDAVAQICRQNGYQILDAAPVLA